MLSLSSVHLANQPSTFYLSPSMCLSFYISVSITVFHYLFLDLYILFRTKKRPEINIKSVAFCHWVIAAEPLEVGAEVEWGLVHRTQDALQTVKTSERCPTTALLVSAPSCSVSGVAQNPVREKLNTWHRWSLCYLCLESWYVC